MGALTEMWKQVEALKEREHRAMPAWCITDDEENGYELLRAPTAEAAKAAYLAEIGVSASAIPTLMVTRATDEQIRRWRGR